MNLDPNLSTSELREVIEVASKRLAYQEQVNKRGGAVEVARDTAEVRPSSKRSDAILLQHVFTYHDDPAKVPNYTAVRTAGKQFAEVILNNVQSCPDRTAALRAVREAVLWANAALALDGVSF